MRLLPGNPAVMMLGITPTTEGAQANLEAQMGLDKPVYSQYVLYLRDLLSGNLGFSWQTGRPVVKDLAQRFPATVELALLSLVAAVFVSIPLGVLSAIHKDSIVDHIARGIALVGIGMPLFWLGLLLIFVFFFLLGWAPAPMGRLPEWVEPPARITGMYLLDSLMTAHWTVFKIAFRQLLLPVFCLSLASFAYITRMVRSGMLEVLHEDYIHTARAKGLRELTITCKHALRNALIPTLTIVALALGRMLSGAVLVETVFAWPGMGKYTVDAIMNRDYAPVQGFIILSALIYAFLNLLVDVCYGILDPRIRY